MSRCPGSIAASLASQLGLWACSGAGSRGRLNTRGEPALTPPCCSHELPSESCLGLVLSTTITPSTTDRQAGPSPVGPCTGCWEGQHCQHGACPDLCSSPPVPSAVTQQLPARRLHVWHRQRGAFGGIRVISTSLALFWGTLGKADSQISRFPPAVLWACIQAPISGRLGRTCKAITQVAPCISNTER